MKIVNYLTRFIIGVNPVGFGLIGSVSEQDSAIVLSVQIGLGRLCLDGCGITGSDMTGSGMTGHCGFCSALFRFFILDFLSVSRSKSDAGVLIFESDCVFLIERVTGRT